MTKNFLNKNVFLCHNCDILPRNQLLLKNEMGFRMKNFDILGASLKSRIFRGEIPKKPIYRGAWTVSRLKEGAWQKRGGGVFVGQIP